MPEPSVAVIVPVYNGAATIAACLDALLALDYPRPALELVVVDNRSTDQTRAIVRDYPVRLVVEDAVQSSYAARNRGVTGTRGALLAFTDADCVPDPGWLRALLAALEPGVGGVAGAILPYSVESAVEQYQARYALRAERAFAHPVLPFAQTANAAYPRTVFERVGGFDAGLVFGGDLDFAWRVQRQTGLRLAYAPEASVRHRHRTTYHGLFKLYAKNALANCLLAGRYPHYESYRQLRTGAYLAREAGRALCAGRLPHAVRQAGELWGWLRWHGRTLARPGTGVDLPALGETTR